MPAQLKIKRAINNDVWNITFSLDTEKLSESDKELMRKFGEPEINVGGIFLAPTPGEENKTYTAVSGTSSGAGTGATFNVVRDSLGAISTVTLVSSGAGYLTGEVITIPGASLGGASPADNLVVTVSTVGITDLSGGVDTFTNTAGTVLGPTPGEENQTYTGVSGTSSGAGTGATFTVVRDSAGDIASVTLVDAGTGYLSNDTITIAGASLGGASPTDNLVITISTVDITDPSGAILTFTNTGGSVLGPVSDPNEFTLPDKYIKIRSGLPYTQEFDSRGTVGIFATNTQEKAEAYQEAFIARYTAAFSALRANADTFTGEYIENI
jgi:hypothetical protein